MIQNLPKEAVVPLAIAGIAIVIVRGLRRIEPREARAIEVIRGRLFRLLHPLDGPLGKTIPPAGEARELVREKGQEDYVCTVRDTLHELQTALDQAGWTYNPVSTEKYRTIETEGGEVIEQYDVATWALRDGATAETQLHAYVFRNENGTLDVYAHSEDNFVSDPAGHTDAGDMRHGDPDGRLRDDLEEAGIDYVRESPAVGTPVVE